MITPFDIYFITRLDNIVALFSIVLTIAAIVTPVLFIVGCIVSTEGEEELSKKLLKLSKILFLLVVIPFSLGRVFTPTTKEACAIVVIPAIANNTEVQDLGKDIIELAHQWVEELKPTAKQ